MAPLPAPRGPGVAVYALLTLGLAGAYLVLRLLRRGGGAGKGRPQIEVVAAKRLGPRHQLLVVRAFGRDHLLSVNGGTTQRIASVRSGEPNEGAAAPASKTMGGLFSKPWIDRSLGSEADADEGTPEPAPLPRPRRARPEENDPAFGAELLQLTSATRARTSAPVRSDSVSGLLRLRQQAGK
ncbi:MAG: flagellar biosynthetic protein FliO [Micrococcales bacterium]|nr:flagellar biosynthetic protein FliO [Micrococcales bacterium]